MVWLMDSKRVGDEAVNFIPFWSGGAERTITDKSIPKKQFRSQFTNLIVRGKKQGNSKTYEDKDHIILFMKTHPTRRIMPGP